MPYTLQRSGRGYYVVTKASGRRHSNRPMSKKRAMAQMRALYAVESGYVLRSRARKRSPFNVRAAKRKGRSVVGWVAFALTIPLVPLLLIAVLPKVARKGE